MHPAKVQPRIWVRVGPEIVPCALLSAAKLGHRKVSMLSSSTYSPHICACPPMISSACAAVLCRVIRRGAAAPARKAVLRLRPRPPLPWTAGELRRQISARSAGHGSPPSARGGHPRVSETQCPISNQDDFPISQRRFLFFVKLCFFGG